jgi:hypothetical protein
VFNIFQNSPDLITEPGLIKNIFTLRCSGTYRDLFYNESQSGLAQGRYLKIEFSDFTDPKWFELSEITLRGHQTQLATGNKRVLPVYFMCSHICEPLYGIDKLFDAEIKFNSDTALRHENRPVQMDFYFDTPLEIKDIIHYNDGIYGSSNLIIQWFSDSLWSDPITFRLSNAADYPVMDKLSLNINKCSGLRLTYSEFNHLAWFQINELFFMGRHFKEKIMAEKIISEKECLNNTSVSGLTDLALSVNNDFCVKINDAFRASVEVIFKEAVTADQIRIFLNNFNGAGYADILYSDDLTGKYKFLKACSFDFSDSVKTSAYEDQIMISSEESISFPGTITSNGIIKGHDVFFQSPVKIKRLNFVFSDFLDSEFFQIHELEFFRTADKYSSDSGPVYPMAAYSDFQAGDYLTNLKPGINDPGFDTDSANMNTNINGNNEVSLKVHFNDNIMVDEGVNQKRSFEKKYFVPQLFNKEDYLEQICLKKEAFKKAESPDRTNFGFPHFYPVKFDLKNDIHEKIMILKDFCAPGSRFVPFFVCPLDKGDDFIDYIDKKGFAARDVIYMYAQKSKIKSENQDDPVLYQMADTFYPEFWNTFNIQVYSDNIKKQSDNIKSDNIKEESLERKYLVFVFSRACIFFDNPLSEKEDLRVIPVYSNPGELMFCDYSGDQKKNDKIMHLFRQKWNYNERR